MVSFIIPVYNSENTIQRCIDSILSQTCNEYEIIAVNDCSQDGSKSRLEEYGEKIVLLENSKNKGVSATRNHALKEAHGDWITFVDSDDYVVPYFVESIEMARRSDSDLLIWKTQTCYSGSADQTEHKTRNMAASYYPHDSFGLGGYR